jgi:hypothetical protein
VAVRKREWRDLEDTKGGKEMAFEESYLLEFTGSE